MARVSARRQSISPSTRTAQALTLKCISDCLTKQEPDGGNDRHTGQILSRLGFAPCLGSEIESCAQ